MGTADRSRFTGATTPVSSGKTSLGKQVLGGLAIVVVVGLCVWGAASGGSDDGTGVPAPATDERAATVPILQHAASSQGICYGWKLLDWTSPVDAGSNLGEDLAVNADPRCPRWVEVVANIRYTSESSESPDRAEIHVEGSTDIDRPDLDTIANGLARFGLDEDAFIDDPGWAVTRAATTLPLLAAEAGLAQPLATPSTGPAAASSPLPAAGSDFWRDRWGWLFGTVGLLLLAALFLTVGVVQRRRQLRAAVPAQRAGAEAAGRTGEKA
ncbi:hypothetical protein [Micromonospora inositola]|uniref:Uncharacterized protein n=1 Tax=Micromonospora inositola TaxID=47865 RepID=A0A1C5HS95_9ACTN|nr:hypothetical protein [Micromonospora inositola]SCG48787.1 hypothetical protein GA0070613_1728 [Micromonospora inositola]